MRKSLTNVSVSDNNMTLTLDDKNIIVSTNGDWTGDMTELIQMLHDLVEMKEQANADK